MPRHDRLRIAALNTWKNPPDHPTRLAALAAGLRAVAAGLPLPLPPSA
jgi:hypothetical protein